MQRALQHMVDALVDQCHPDASHVAVVGVKKPPKNLSQALVPDPDAPPVEPKSRAGWPTKIFAVNSLLARECDFVAGLQCAEDLDWISRLYDHSENLHVAMVNLSRYKMSAPPHATSDKTLSSPAGWRHRLLQWRLLPYRAPADWERDAVQHLQLFVVRLRMQDFKSNSDYGKGGFEKTLGTVLYEIEAVARDFMGAAPLSKGVKNALGDVFKVMVSSLCKVLPGNLASLCQTVRQLADNKGFKGTIVLKAMTDYGGLESIFGELKVLESDRKTAEGNLQDAFRPVAITPASAKSSPLELTGSGPPCKMVPL